MGRSHAQITRTDHMHISHAHITCTDHVHRSQAQITCTDHKHRSHAQISCIDHMHRSELSPAAPAGHLWHLPLHLHHQLCALHPHDHNPPQVQRPPLLSRVQIPGHRGDVHASLRASCHHLCHCSGPAEAQMEGHHRAVSRPAEAGSCSGHRLL